MPIFDDSPVTTFTPRPTVNVVPPPPEPQGGSFLDVMQAAGRTENDIVAAVDLLTQPKQKVDLNFNLLEEAKKRNVDAADYTDALNPAHLDQLIAKRNQEDRDNAMLDQAGWGGFLARVAAGIVSPTTLLPMVGPETTGLKTMLTVGLNAAAGAAMQEGVLYADQRTRTKTQAAYSIGSSLLLGSVLGGIAHTLKPSELARMSHDMANAPEGFAISSPTPSILDAGAKETNNLADAGQLKKGWGAHLLSPMSGITRNFEQWNAPKYIKDLGGAPQVRKMTAGFSQADLILQNNADFIAASRGGNVEQIKRVYNGVSYEGTVALQNAYQDYILGADAKGWFKQGRATLAGSRRPDGKLTWGEFKKQVTEDWMTGQTAVGVPDPVRKAAKEVAEKVYKALYDEGVKYGVFTGKEVPVGDENYINRVYNDEVIMRRRPEFEQILASNYQRQLDKDFGEKLQRLQDAMVKDKQRLSDMQLPLDQAQKLRDDLIHAKVDVTDATNPQVIQGAELLKANAKAVKELTKELDDLRKVKIDVNDLGAYKSRTDRMGEIEAALKQKALEAEGTKKALGDELAKYQKDAAEIRRRLNNLNNNIHIKDTRLKKKLDKIVANEDAQAETILRASKQLQKFVKFLDSASPDKIEQELTKLKNSFADHAAKYDKAQQDLIKLENDGYGPDVFSGKDNTPPQQDKVDVVDVSKTTPPEDVLPTIQQLQAPIQPKPVEVDTDFVDVTDTVQAFKDFKKIDDIASSNVDDALANLQHYDTIDDAKAAYWKNVKDTLKDEGIIHPDAYKRAQESYNKWFDAELPKELEKLKKDSDINTASKFWRTGEDARSWLEEHGREDIQAIMKKIKPHLDNTNIAVVDKKGPQPKDTFLSDFWRSTDNGQYCRIGGHSGTAETLLLISKEALGNMRTLPHELIHASLAHKIEAGIKGLDPALTKQVDQLRALLGHVEGHVREEIRDNPGWTGLSDTNFYTKYSVYDIHELAANVFVNPGVAEFYRSIPYKSKTVYDAILDVFRKILGIKPEEENAFNALIDITDRMWKEPNLSTAPYRGGKKLAEDGLPPEMKLSDKMDALSGKMDTIAAKIEQLDAHDPVKFKQEVEQAMRDLADTHAKINAKRVIRNEKLWKQVEAMSPEARARKIADLELKAKERPRKFIERFRDTNAGKMAIDSESGLLQGNGDFAAHAKEMAKDTVTKILGSERRLAYSDIIREKRGPELARVLNIPSAEIKDFLEMDMERLMAIYTRTVGGDTAIAKVFGSADAAAEFAKLDDEMNSMLAKIETLTDKKGNPLDQKAKEDITKQTHDFYDAARKNLYVLMERAKGMRGIPKDAGSWSARGAKMVMDINFMRLMGNVLISSVADPGRAVMKFGLTRTFRDGLLPMITNLKTLRMSQHEARLAGVALDPIIHSRAAALADIFDDAHRGTKIEKAVHWASTKMGLAAGFDHWTSAIKQFTAGIANAKLLDNISAVMEGKVKGKQLVKAQEYLSKLNIDADFAERIWKEVTSGEGGGKVNGIWLPNTENWTDREAVLAYRAALGSEVDATIITPGFERPNWVDSSLPAKMMAQFKSFGFTSTQKTLMAGLQEHDLAFMNGVISSLALGALSYYLYGVFTGGKTYTEMMNAGPDKWADEAISRSGVTAIFDEAQRISARVPLLQKYTSFSGRQTTRRGGGDLASEILGPSFDALSRVTKIASEIDSPTKSTLHTVRTLLPLQNIFYLRQLLDKVEAAAGSKLPKKRSAQ